MEHIQEGIFMGFAAACFVAAMFILFRMDAVCDDALKIVSKRQCCGYSLVVGE